MGDCGVRRSGMTPAQIVEGVVLFVVDGAAGADLRRGLVDRQRRGRGSCGARSRWAGGRRRSGRGRRARRGASRARSFSSPGHFARGAEDDGGAVVHRVMERGARHDQAVEQRDGDAGVGRRSAALRSMPAGGRAVEVERVAVAPVDGGDDDGLPVDDEADVADQRLVEDGVDGGGVVFGRAPAGDGRWCARFAVCSLF